MAWTPGLWPKAEDDDIAISDFNELNDELNARAGVANAAFTGGADTPSLWNAIDAMQDRIYAVIQAKFGDVTTGYKYALPGTAEVLAGSCLNRTRSLFDVLYGDDREDFLDSVADGEGRPPTEGNNPFTHYVNELYDVIDALKWRWDVIASISSPRAVRKAFGYQLEDTKQESLDEAYAGYLAETEAAYDLGVAYFWALYVYSPGAVKYLCAISSYRTFAYVDLPDDITIIAAKVFLYRVKLSVYDADVGQKKPPEWNLNIAISPTSPMPLGAGDWTFGTLQGGIPVDLLATNGAVSTDLDPPASLAIPDFTSEARNYIQMNSDDNISPQHVVDDGNWGDYHDAQQRITPDDIRFWFQVAE